ncbi:hypothetical protein AG0111_0g11700 [Alternaria gaisen]|uniref:Uncharacterized protein n=1 Tax=Alternaria gaisen TaxID=167740 RepID=A0ACB6F6M9_9PLEO|nr:hypothetical protein AG0111_0g11700 [Alternaria gaisen]
MDSYHHDSFPPLDPSYYHEPGFLNSGTTNLDQQRSPIGNRNVIAPPSGDLPGNDPQNSNADEPMQRVVELLKQTVPMHISEEKLLREVKKAQEELEKKQEDLKKGQEELKKGQEELKRGQEASMRVQGQMSETMSDILAIGKKTAHRSDYASFRGSRSRLEYAPHSEPALPDQRRTIVLRPDELLEIANQVRSQLAHPSQSYYP